MNLVQRLIRLFRIGKAFREVRSSTDGDKKIRAQKLLLELLGQSQGLPTKIGQFLSMKENGNGLQHAFDASITPMSFHEVEQILNRQYQGNYLSVFKNVKPQGRAASIGQVHAGTLKDGRAVAIKVQYPEIKETVENELKLLGWLPEMGPVKKWGMDLGGYVQELRNHLATELDYREEARQQIYYKNAAGNTSEIIIPEVFPEYSCETVLVQSFEKGEPIEKAAGASLEIRHEIAKSWVRHILYMMFQKGVVHSDPNPRNFAFRIKGNQPAIVIYDFGSLHEIPEEQRMLLLRIILAIRSREKIDPARCLKGLGFDLEKLNDIRACLPGLLSILFEPFTTNDPFDLKSWDINKRWDNVVGELKWWFRSAAPPEGIFLMRTFHGLTRHLDKLDVRVSWSRLLDEAAGDLFASAKAWPLPGLGEDESTSSFSGLSQYLKINVEKGNGNRVALTMPARVAENLEEVIDPKILESIRKQNIDLNEVQLKVQRSGFVAQSLFELSDSERDVKVWLE